MYVICVIKPAIVRAFAFYDLARHAAPLAHSSEWAWLTWSAPSHYLNQCWNIFHYAHSFEVRVLAIDEHVQLSCNIPSCELLKKVDLPMVLRYIVVEVALLKNNSYFKYYCILCLFINPKMSHWYTKYYISVTGCHIWHSSIPVAMVICGQGFSYVSFHKLTRIYNWQLYRISMDGGPFVSHQASSSGKEFEFWSQIDVPWNRKYVTEIRLHSENVKCSHQ